MRLTRLELSNFRNISKAELSFEGNRHFFLGSNGQGKTNLLEAIALSQGLKSFRAGKPETLIALGKPEAILRSTWQHEKLKDTTLGISINRMKRNALLDGKSTTARETLGLFPVVALTLADRALLYGGHAARRDEIDHLISQIDPAYIEIIDSYASANRSRNALLASPPASPSQAEAQLTSFENVMASSARRLIKSRARAIDLLQPFFDAAYAKFAPAAEVPGLAYTPNAPHEELPALLRDLRAKDAATGFATRGPHRDHYEITLNSEPAESFASEGQKFSLVLALKLAGLQLLRERLGIAPVLVADDLLLELDATRQEKFWASVGDLQVFASGTVRPANQTDQAWKVWNVKEGVFIAS